MKEKVALTPDMLEVITGGVMTEKAEMHIDEEIGRFKKNNPLLANSKEETIKYFLDNFSDIMKDYPDVTKEEGEKYINDCWLFL